MKLFLGGGGGGKDSIELDKKFVATLDLSKPLLYIPIALGDEKYPYSTCFDWVSDVLNPLGVTNIVMWTEKELSEKTEKDFEQFSGVYIGGGNTFKLLKELKEFGTFEILRKLAQKDIPIYGGSAGAIILGPTITNAIGFDENNIELTDLHALNLTHDYEIWCHYQSHQSDLVLKYMAKYNLGKIIAIPEAAGLMVTESRIEVIGPLEITVFNKHTISIIEPKQRIQI